VPIAPYWDKFRFLIWRGLHYVPLLQSLLSFSRAHHAVALKKFLTLWFLSLVPGIASFVLLSDSQPRTVLGQFRAAFTPAEQFIYAVSFFSPILYLLWERLQQREKFIAAGKKSQGVLAIIPRGFGVVQLLTLMVFIFSAVGFGAAKAWDVATATPAQLRFGRFSANAAIIIYIYGVYCWYLSIVMSVDAESSDFELANRAQEDAATKGLQKRIASRGADDAE
jgi:hypothetical protein